MFNSKLHKQISILQQEIEQLKLTNNNLSDQLSTKDSTINNLKLLINQLQSQLSKYSTKDIDNINAQISTKQNELSSITCQLDSLTNQLKSAENELHLQSLSFFEIEHNSQYYKNEIYGNRIKQRDILSKKDYYKITDVWYINGDSKEGAKLSKFLIDICITSLNQMCDSLMRQVNVANYQSYRSKINRAWDNYNDTLIKFNIVPNRDYLKLKLEELELCRNIAIKLDEEKEELARQKEILREEIRIEKELEKEKEKLNQALLKYKIQLSEGLEVQDKIDEILDKLGNNEKILQGKRCGFIYIISNSSFGKDTIKIGLTRQSDWTSRLDQLNSASVPFLFKPNCVLWSNDCFVTENEIHKRLHKYRVNKINTRKEFFKIPLEELEKIIKEEFDPNAVFDYDVCDPNFIASNYILSDNFIDKDNLL